MPTNNCPQCTYYNNCRNNHLYVIELDKSVLFIEYFLTQNNHIDIANIRAVKGCFYVGSTSHRCDCRFEQHKNYSAHMEGFRCDCFGPNIFREFTKCNSGGKFAGDFGMCLRPDIFFGLNQKNRTQEEAQLTERILAELLREAGNAVWQN